MDKEKSKQYKKYIGLIVEEFKALKPYIIHQYDDVWLLKFKNKNINKYHIEIWPVGKGTNYDDSRNFSICIFGIHNWRIDKIRPSYADWSIYYEIDKLESHYKDDDPPYLLFELKETLNCIKHNPIFSYFHFGDIPHHNMYLEYIKSAWYSIVVRWYHRYIKERCIPYLLFILLYFISLFDRKIDKRHILINYWNDAYPSFTFGFPIKAKTPEYAIYKRWKIYSYYPSKIIKNRAFFEVYDVKKGDKPKAIRKGLFRGIRFNE